MLTWVVASGQVQPMSLATGIVAVAANILGALTPDLDEPTAGLWNDLPAGSIIGRIIHPLLGGHRMITHSLVGMFAIGWGLKYLLIHYVSRVLLVDMNIVWVTFMLGFLSHLIMDTITKEGVPWLFPIPWKIGFPPFKALRVTTGEWAEKALELRGVFETYRKVVFNTSPLPLS
ncbi:MAG: Uncharacterized protein G01um101416_350 [Microgenomates group bacterium Gr01-1014_16]|nr:MAG: Uncharacterized protein G01um101416_350 [Microgenomates group bacterium Gr01-1014_16]